ncbi:uncharacterized protein LOC141718833 isoform X3 [Apium graveolens]|uniref:uncharacterized protein LOC141718833 isoform X3 n=1 Tax=Apium graveolens TaxID=4045 RepID=UPI003D78FE95
MKVQLITILLAVPLLNILQGLGILSVSSHCLVDQKSLLLQFKNNLKFNSTLSSKLVLWNQSTDCCTWEGVTCSTSGNSGHVIGLDLNSESISGCLQNSTLSSLSNFQYLESLNLAFNNFSSSEFPAGIFSLTSLKYLNLSTSGFSGKIPSSIANLTQLVYLDFWTNNFSGTISSIHFENLVNLEYIDLGLNLLSGIIPSSLFALPSLRKLFLSYNNFHGSLPNFTNTHSSQLDTLYSSWNNLSGSVPNSLFELQSFSRLTLSHNKLSGEFKLQNLHRLGNLTYFNLSFNNLSLDSRHNSSSKFLPPMLKELKLASCRLRQFPELRNLPSLITLDLAENQIPGDIPNWIWNVGNGGLQYLNLSVNRLEKLEEPYVIHNLSWIDLRSNHLRGKLPIPPKKNFAVWKAMKDGRNDVNILGFQFSSFGNSRKTYQDAVTINIKGKQLELVKILNIFTSVDISNNHFEGNIPHTIGELKSLVSLNLSHNTLSGSIPKSIGTLKLLETLDLSMNKLTGKIPAELGDMSFLAVLDLSDNQLTGKIPTGNQIQTFSDASFERNKGLCGAPLQLKCGGVPVITVNYDEEDPGENIKWEFVAPEVGFAVGLGIVILPLILNKRWRSFYYERVDHMLFKVFRIKHQKKNIHGRIKSRGSRIQRARN